MIVVSKADGTTENFKPEKLITSLKRAGADADDAVRVEHEIEKELWSGISTQQIYSRAFTHLREHRRGVAARYSLKRAILEFGPSGFPFEAYLSELFRTEGYATKIDQIVKGRCVEHEVDVVMEKDSETTYVEAKFHNTLGFRSDLKVVLYVEARVEDIAARYPGAKGMVVTNTKFTSKALEYATCRGLELLAWDYPQPTTLHERIALASLYPITTLTTLSHREKTALLSDGIVLTRMVAQKPETLEQLGITGAKASRVLEEIGALSSKNVIV